jgi:multiple sugar transport system ATP-binding protein
MANLQVRDISKSFGAVSVLRDVSLEVQDGEFLTLLGPSGCGKSTLLRIIAGLEQPSTGSVLIGGQSVTEWRPRDRDVAMVFQTYALYPHMTVADNLALPLRMRRLSTLQRLPLIGRMMKTSRVQNSAIAQEVSDLAKSLELHHLLGRKPGQLSGGQRQRVALARAMVRRPAVFLMDEPLSNLDAKLRTQMRAEIASLRRKLSAAFVYVTHDQTEAMTMSDRVAVMFEGKIAQLGSPQMLYTQPATRQVAEFIGSPRINLLNAVVRHEGAAEVADVSLPIPRGMGPGTAISVGVRPESMHIAERRGPGCFTGRVQRVEYMGNDLLVYFHVLGHGEPLVMRAAPRHGTHLRADSTIHVSVARDSLLLFDSNGEAIRSGTSTLAQLRSYRAP